MPPIARRRWDRVLKWQHVAILPRPPLAIPSRSCVSPTTSWSAIRSRASSLPQGGEPSTRVLDQVDYRSALRAKLLEEAREAEAASDGRLASELADVLDVFGPWPRLTT
jgi:hypothetical protein